MKPMTAVAALGLALGMMASASAQTITTDTFGSGANTFSLQFNTVGNPGNAAQSASNRSHNFSDGDGRGSVPYTYRMSTYAISQNNITTATAAGMTNVTAGAHTGDRPAADITWYEAAAYVNWLNTSQGHQAAYDLNFTTSWSMTLWSSADAWQLGGENLYRHKDAYYFLPSDNEWYKAAYYDPTTTNYYLYATGSDTAPTAVSSGTAAGSAVYNGQPGPADVDLSGDLSPYGTMGQSGNVWEWAESAWEGTNNISSEARAIRGGFWSNPESALRSSTPSANLPTDELVTIGFRVASVPEPSGALLMMMGLGALLLRRRANRSL